MQCLRRPKGRKRTQLVLGNETRLSYVMEREDYDYASVGSERSNWVVSINTRFYPRRREDEWDSRRLIELGGLSTVHALTFRGLSADYVFAFQCTVGYRDSGKERPGGRSIGRCIG